MILLLFFYRADIYEYLFYAEFLSFVSFIPRTMCATTARFRYRILFA